MTIDERLEALTQSLELMASIQRDREARQEKTEAATAAMGTRLDKVETVLAAMGSVIESHDRQLGLLIEMAKDNAAAARATDKRIADLVSGIGEFMRRAS
jgi:hypothetical protein